MRRIWRCRVVKDWKYDDPTIPMKIAPEFVELANLFFKVAKSRSKGRRKRQSRVDGWLGQICFQSLLIRLKIPYLPHHPLYPPEDIEYAFPFDFYVANFGTIEVKGTARYPNYRKLMLAKNLWNMGHPDYAVGVKIHSDEKATIMGWATREEVENEFDVEDYGDGPAYTRPLDQLRPMSSFVKKLERILDVKK